MSDAATVAIAGIFALTVGCAAAYGGLALILNLRRLRDRLLKNYADRPGGWHRSDHHDPSHETGAGFGISFEYVPKTPAQVRFIGWVLLLIGLFLGAIGLLILLVGEVE